ncbi:MAG: glycosyltransferase family 2 protein [Saprospiraceae bacterium]|nr:glycosyltransferase family 2 protein [Saprospiraceae bacterium]
MEKNQVPVIDVIIPAWNEELSIGLVINEIPENLVRHIIVCDNGSSDNTAKVAAAHGAIVVEQPLKGYGNACLKGMAYINKLPIKPDIIVFLDGDHSDFPAQMAELISPIMKEDVDMVIGSRALGELEKGSMMPQQIFGNWLATTLIRILYNYNFTDLGPFRAIRYEALMVINMQDKTYGWTVEMQVKAAKLKLKTDEVPVRYRRRIGTSKVSGTIKGTVMAGYKILWTIFKLI